MNPLRAVEQDGFFGAILRQRRKYLIKKVVVLVILLGMMWPDIALVFNLCGADGRCGRRSARGIRGIGMKEVESKEYQRQQECANYDDSLCRRLIGHGAYRVKHSKLSRHGERRKGISN